MCVGFQHNSRRWVLVAAVFWVLLAQSAAEQLPIKNFTTAQGLAHERVSQIVRDSHGFLWFSTNDGLSRFDGQNFVNYTPRDGLAHSRVSSLLESRDGTYWVATANGLSSFVPARDSLRFYQSGATADGSQSSSRPFFNTYKISDHDKNANYVSILFEDRAGHLWAGTQGGLYLVNRTPDAPPTFQHIGIGHPSKADDLFEIDNLLEDDEGSLWIGGLFGLARRLPDGRFAHYSIHPSEGIDSVRTMIRDRDGRLWLGHQSGLMVFKPEPLAGVRPGLIALEKIAQQPNLKDGRVLLPNAPGETRWYTKADGLVDQRVRAICETKDGHVWLGTPAGGVAEFDGERFRNLLPTQGVSRLISALTEDTAGNLWVGALIGGVTKIERSGFLTYKEPDGLAMADVFSIFEDRDQQLIVVNNAWSMNRFDGNRFVAVKPNLPEKVKGSSTGNRPMIQTRDGEWWIATGEGLFRFPAVARFEDLATINPQAAYFEKDGLASSNISRMFEDSRGDVWISSYTPPVTLTRWERATGKFYRYGVDDGIPPNNWPHVFAEDRAGNVWMGLHYGELMRVRNGKFEVFRESDGLPHSMMQGLFCDRIGRLWIATGGGGIARVDHPEADKPLFAIYRMEQGLSSNNNRCFTEDGWGRIYIGTARGVDRLDVPTGQIKHFTADDGLSTGEVVAAFTDHDGSLWFGTREGLSRLKPTEADSQLAPPPIFISNLVAGSNPQPIPELGLREVGGLVLEPDQNQIQIEFFSLSFAAGSQLRYQYKFENADRDWSLPSEQRTVTANLSPGRYRFLVRAINASGQTSTEPAVVTFRILPPFYRRWWFVALIAMATGAIGYFAYRQRVSRLVAIERVRTRIATDLHDDIGASLSRVAILSEVVKQQGQLTHHEDRQNGRATNGQNLRSTQMLTEIADSARGLVDSMSDIVWSIDPRRDDLGQVITRTRQFAADVLDVQGISWQFIASADVEKIKLDPEQRRHLFLIFKESLNNIARHAGAKTVSMNLSIAHNRLEAEIADDGHGFTPQPAGTAVAVLPKSRGGNGVGNMQARAKELGGELKIDSTPGKGTRLTLSVPLKR
ncbi:MAG: hypothetical protein JST85_02680 [Acidobacteria bacterium]|nr:hypothetical protein [Acidobacteriota bacterium]